MAFRRWGVVALAFLTAQTAYAGDEFSYKGMKLGSSLSAFKKKFSEFGCQSGANKNWVECTASSSTYADVSAVSSSAKFLHGSLISVLVDFGEQYWGATLVIPKISEKFGAPSSNTGLHPDGPNSLRMIDSTKWSKPDGSFIEVLEEIDYTKSNKPRVYLLISKGKWKEKSGDL